MLPRRQKPDEPETLLGTLLKGYGAYRIASLGAQMAGMGEQFTLSGGDMRSEQLVMNMVRSIPVVGGIFGSVVTPVLEKEITLQATRQIMERMQLTPTSSMALGFDEEKGLFASPTLVREAQKWAFSGLQIPGSVGKAFEQPQTLVDEDHFSAATVLRKPNPAYIPPELRTMFLGALLRARQSDYAMGTLGYASGAGDEPSDLLQASLAAGDFGTATILWSYYGKDVTMPSWERGEDGQYYGVQRTLTQEREIQGKILGHRWEAGRLAQEAANVGTRIRRASGLGAYSAAAVGYQTAAWLYEREMGEYDYEIEDVRAREEGARRSGNRAAQEGARKRRLELERQKEEARISAQESGIAAVETQRGGEMSEYGSFARRFTDIAGTFQEFGAPAAGRMAFGMSAMEMQRLSAESAVAKAREMAAQGVTGAKLASYETEAQGQLSKFVSMAGGLASTPIDLRLQRDQSYTNYQISILSQVPGSYGNLRGAIGAQIGFKEQEAAQIMEMREMQRKQGVLTEYADKVYQERLQRVGMEQIGLVNQLSYGWESRLASQMLGTPGSFNVEARGFSWRNAVQRGIVNPHFGATEEQLPFYLQWANLVNLPQIPGYKGPYPLPDSRTGVPGINLPGLAKPGDTSGWGFGSDNLITPVYSPAPVPGMGGFGGNARGMPAVMAPAILGIAAAMGGAGGGGGGSAGGGGSIKLDGELVLKDNAGNTIGTAYIRGNGQQQGGIADPVPMGPWSGFNALAEEVNRILNERQGALDQ